MRAEFSYEWDIKKHGKDDFDYFCCFLISLVIDGTYIFNERYDFDLNPFKKEAVII